MYRTAVAALATAAALSMGTVVAQADMTSYVTCATMSLNHLGTVRHH